MSQPGDQATNIEVYRIGIDTDHPEPFPLRLKKKRESDIPETHNRERSGNDISFPCRFTAAPPEGKRRGIKRGVHHGIT